MQGVNKVTLIGHLGKDPEIRHFENTRSVVNFTLATSESYRDKEGNKVENTEWHNISSWSAGLNDVMMKYLHKGSPVYVEGKLRTRQYQDKENVTRYITEIVVDEMRLLGAKPATVAQMAAAPAVTYAQEPEPEVLPF